MSPNKTSNRTFNRWLKVIDNQKNVVEEDDSWKFQPSYIGHLGQIIDQTLNHEFWNQTLPIIIDKVSSTYEIAKDLLGQFGIKVQAITSRDPFPLFKGSAHKMKKYELSPTSYEAFIETLAVEIRNKEHFHF